MSNSNVNPINFREIAERVFNKLDAKDGSTDGYINQSIWNQFVGVDVDGQQVGYGDKSKINFKIAKEPAIKSIISYLKKTGNLDLFLKKTDEIEEAKNTASVKNDTEVSEADDVKENSEIATDARRYIEIKNKLLPKLRKEYGTYLSCSPPKYAGDEESIDNLIFIINDLRQKGKTEEADKNQKALQELIALKAEMESIEKKYPNDELLKYILNHKDDYKDIIDFDKDYYENFIVN